jgi:DNA-binding transcriptional ArsR family regulator
MLLFITESTIFSSVQKANLLELLENPSQTKEDLLYLFEWFLENVFNKIKNDVRKSNQKYLRLLEKNIQEDGTTYLERLNIVSLFDVLETVTTLELSVSPFLGLDQASLMVNKDRYLFILGYDRVEVPFRKKDERLECIDVFDALADRERLAILKELSREPNRPVSLAKKLKISAGDLSNHFEKLKKGRLLESVYDGEHVKYTVKSENIRRLVNESLDKLLDEN